MEAMANWREAPFTQGFSDAPSPRTQHSLPKGGKPNTNATLRHPRISSFVEGRNAVLP